MAYFSPDAAESARWLARYEVPVKPRTGSAVPDAMDPEHELIGGGKPDPVGYLPLIFRGSTSGEAIKAAQDHWDRVIAEERQKRENIAAGAAKRRMK